MFKDFKFNVSADASDPNLVAQELMAIKAALGFILAELPSSSQARVTNHLSEIDDDKAKKLADFLSQFKGLHGPD